MSKTHIVPFRPRRCLPGSLRAEACPGSRALRRGESGMVLVAALLVMAMLSLLGIAGLATSSLEVRIAGHDRDAKQAFYLAEAGLLRAQYEIVKGWGTGAGVPGSFTFDASTMPEVVKAGAASILAWETDKWVGFRLVDSQGNDLVIADNPSGYQLECVGDPASGRATLYYGKSVPAYASPPTGVTVVGTEVVVSPSPAWPVDQWQGMAVRDFASPPNWFSVLSNTGDTLTLSGTLATSNFQIWRGTGGTGTFTVYDDPGGDPARPSGTWGTGGHHFGDPSTDQPWYLRDRNGTFFRITDTDFGVTAAGVGYMELAVAGTPASGEFQITTNPWVAANAGTPVLLEAGPGKDFEVPSNIDSYGSARVAVNEIATGRFVITSTSAGTTAGNTKAIGLDARMGRGGTVSLTNWRQIQ